MFEIKFRAMRADNKEWIYGSPYEKYMICGLSVVRSDEQVAFSEYVEFDYVEIIPETIGQLVYASEYSNFELYVGDAIIIKTFSYRNEHAGPEYKSVIAIIDIDEYGVYIEMEDGGRCYWCDYLPRYIPEDFVKITGNIYSTYMI